MALLERGITARLLQTITRDNNTMKALRNLVKPRIFKVFKCMAIVSFKFLISRFSDIDSNCPGCSIGTVP